MVADPIQNHQVTQDFLANSSGGPTVLRILLGTQLRRLRQEKGISRHDAGYAIRASHAKISRMELGQVSFKHRDVDDLLKLYGVDDREQREALLGLISSANAQGWWHQYGDVLPHWFGVYVGLEEAASMIRTYEVQFVPGLLQSEDYARAVIRLSRTATSDEDVDSRVHMRMHRQRRLTIENDAENTAPRLWAVIDEAVLHRPYGNARVMRGQIEHLIEMSRRPNVTIQIATFAMGGHPAAGGPFSILRFPTPQLPDVVYLEQLNSALYFDKFDDTSGYAQTMDHLATQAPRPSDTQGILERFLELHRD
ncbi:MULTISPECIES: helix-turn-helix domain-containing protein [Nocardiopsis]|uniref:Helix-turn-helix domain-containing protein n=3 Tax=Nocardiopsis alba TaxID=53437 RepID=A0A7K2IQX3_9ACTN|nr:MULTISPECIES: helix-turn-helix transcriptional regulator [Nocardiopsis]AFR05960.1 helix-turn-helix domain protein [Nocardiopsis alba ATCC BAA-2165]MEC3892757.1 helix-turn-helix transcriptional regulator [Nocardiopsis sp. LDBS1602]MYR32323.1 helix-turn-helix domain-containing protein [Nocardiopsis alba]